MKIPADLLYTSDHEWVKKEGNRVVVGITDYAQDQLGDVVFVEVPEVGTELTVGDVLATIESVKAVSEVYSPIAGKVIEANDELTDAPELINGEAYGKGWIAVLALNDESELAELLSAEAYQKLLTEEA